MARRTFLAAALATVGLGAVAGAAAARAAIPEAVVYRTPWCGCCGAYVDYLRRHGVAVRVEELEDLSLVKRTAGVPERLESCHTALIDGYTVEGHVPIEAIERLLAERPPVRGIAVPGMPAGSPGMEGPRPESYRVVAFADGEPAGVFMRF